MLYQVTVKKIVEQAVTVEASSEEEAKYKASVQASDSDTIEILSTDDVTEIVT